MQPLLQFAFCFDLTVVTLHCVSALHFLCGSAVCWVDAAQPCQARGPFSPSERAPRPSLEFHQIWSYELKIHSSMNSSLSLFLPAVIWSFYALQVFLHNDMEFSLVNPLHRTWSEMPWTRVGLIFFFLPPGTCYSGNGQFYQGLANITASGIPCQKWSDQVRISVRLTERRPVLEVCFSKEFSRDGQLSLSGKAEQGTGSLYSWVHWCFPPSSYLSLQVPLWQDAFWQATERLFHLCFSLLLCFIYGFVLLMPTGKIVLKH